MPKCNACDNTTRHDLFTVNGYTLGRCTKCNLHYIDPMPDNTERLADVHAGRYGDQLVLDGTKQLAAERAQSATFETYLDLIQRHGPTKGDFLDVGCGAGHFMSMAKSAGYIPQGIELTADRLELARAGGFTVHDQPIEELDVAAGSLAVVTMINVFSHLADPKRTICEVARSLQPGGVFLMATGEIAGSVEKGHLPEWTLGDEMFYLGDGTIGRYAEAAGLELVETKRTWLPDAIFSRERFKVRGRSKARNAVKSALLIPGALPALRWAMKRRQSSNPIYSAVYVLKKA